MTKCLLIVLALTAGAAAYFTTAECAWCPSYTCYMRCSSDCACVTVGGGSGGQCVSVQNVPMLEKVGYRVLP